jgi:DNA-binding LacI/PurR family transcriptional regulator
VRDRPGVKPATVKEVARVAGVSAKTVSNVINGYNHVSDDIRSRVQAAAAELGYRPNVVARALRQGHPATLTLIVPEPGAAELTTLVEGLLDVARAFGLSVVTDRVPSGAESACFVVLGYPPRR